MQGHEVKVHACHRTARALGNWPHTATLTQLTMSHCNASVAALPCPAPSVDCYRASTSPSLMVSLCCVTTGRGRSPALTETLPRPPPARCTSPAPYPAHHTLDLSTNLREVKLGCLSPKILTNGWL